jgi:ParB/RepB/Spo0J family partition protein
MTESTLPDVQLVPIDQIKVETDFNPRTQFEVKAIEELAASIRERGLLQPLTVRLPLEDEPYDGYVLVTGERRLRACQGSLELVPCIVTNGRAADAGERTVDALVENIQREDLSIADEVKAYGRLKEEHGWNAQRIATAVGLPQGRVTRRMQLLVLPEDAIDAAAELNDKGRKALVTIAAASPDVAGEIAKYLAGQSEEVRKDFGKEPCKRLAPFQVSKLFPLMAEGSQYDAAAFLLTEEAHDARTTLSENAYGPTYVRVSDEVVKDADSISATVQLVDGKLIIGWDACCQVAGDYLVRLLKEREERLAERDKDEPWRDTGGSSSRVVVNAEGEAVVDDDEKTRIRKERYKAEIQERQDAESFNEALGIAMIGRLPSIEITAPLARLLSRLVLVEHGTDFAARGLRYIHPNGKDPESKKVTRYVESNELQTLLDDWMNGARKTDEIFARLFIVLLAAEYADHRCVAMSNRRGQGVVTSGYQATSDSKEVIESELEKLLKKALPKSLFEQAVERARQLAGVGFGGYEPDPDPDSPDEGLEGETSGSGEEDADPAADEVAEAE